MDSHRKRDFDVEHRKETNLVDRPVPDTSGEHRDVHHNLDGNRRGKEQAKLVGNFADCTRRRDHRARLSGLV